MSKPKNDAQGDDASMAGERVFSAVKSTVGDGGRPANKGRASSMALLERDASPSESSLVYGLLDTLRDTIRSVMPDFPKKQEIPKINDEVIYERNRNIILNLAKVALDPNSSMHGHLEIPDESGLTYRQRLELGYRACGGDPNDLGLSHNAHVSSFEEGEQEDPELLQKILDRNRDTLRRTGFI